MFSFQETLFEKYEKKIIKEVKKVFYNSNNKDFVFHIKEQEFDFELYNIFNTERLTGYLFLKEVKSCNLNGCQSMPKANNNIGSEYYNISIITDLELNIKSVIVLDYFSDYGYEITSKRYLKQFREISLCNISHESASVDGISGATISYNALISSIEGFCLSIK